MKLLLVGNPNAGKSTLYNRLTGGHARVGNWHGVTVGALEGRASLAGGQVTVVDLPGIYTPQGRSMEERLTRAYLDENRDAAALFVAECTSLPRTLPLLFALCKGRKTALVLTKRRAFERRGGRVDGAALAQRLGCPVFFAEGKKRELLQDAGRVFSAQPLAERNISLDGVWAAEREELGRLDALLMNGAFALPFFAILLAAAFYVTFAPGCLGDFLKGAIEHLFVDVLGGCAAAIPSAVVRSFVIDALLAGLGTVLGFLPQIALLFFFLIVLEESGFLSRLAALTDGVFAGAGLNGRAVFSLVMGFGCTAAAILSTRGLDDRRVQRRTILCLPYISCSAKLPVYLTLAASFFDNPFLAVLLLYALGVGIALLVAVLTSRGPRAPFLLELAPLQVPGADFVLKALLFQIKQFIIKTATVILVFFAASWLFSGFGWDFRPCDVEDSMLASVCTGLKWLFAPVGMGDWRIAYAALSGLIAKENVAGTIAMFYGAFPYGGASAFALAVFVLTCSPCVSAVAASARELGAKRAVLYAVLQTLTALLACYLAYFLWTGGLVYALLLCLPVAAFLLLRTRHESVCRKRGHKTLRIHR